MKRILQSLKGYFQKIFSNKRIKVLLPYLLIIGVIVISLFSFTILLLSQPIKLEDSQKEIVIPKGSSLLKIADILEKRKIVDNKRTFVLATKLMLKGKSLKAGSFYLNNVKGYRSLISTLSNSQQHSFRITIPEGYQSKEIAQLLSLKLNCSYDDFMEKVKDKRFAEQLGIESPDLEGYLFPDTYHFSESDSVEVIIGKMVFHFIEMINDSIREGIEKSGKNLHEVLTLASIVEGECIVDGERPLVASVYINRLKKGIRLESDPTIQYIIPDSPRRLLNKDLNIRSPYNTYRYRGLPPGPINNPGIKSIVAAVWPAETDYLYMVANGDGTHTFTNNYSDFLRAKRKFQKLRRRVASELKKEKNN